MTRKLALAFVLLLLAGGARAVDYQSNGTGGGLYSVGASWNPVGVPGPADTFDILVGEIITIDGNVWVGGAPGSDTTYNINIQGTLIWPQSPAGNWTFMAESSIRLQGAGKFYIGCSPGSPTDRLNCSNYAIVEFQTWEVKYDLRIDGASAQLIARGCEGYHASSGTETRARITACNPDCNAGANRTLTLDTNVNWQAVTNPVTVGGTGNPEVILGAGGNITAPGAFNSELTEIDLYPAANQVRVTALANNHQIGDMVVNPTKNILFKSSNAANHGSIYSVTPSGTTLSPFGLSWVRLDEVGDGKTATTAAIGIDLNAVASNFGTIEYTWLTNCEDGASTYCFYIQEGDWDSFDYNGVYDPGSASGRGVHMLSNRFDKTVTGFTAIRVGWNISGIAWYNNNGCGNVAFDKFWVSDNGYHFHGGAQGFTDSLFHHSRLDGLYLGYGCSFEKRRPFIFKNNEVRNSTFASMYCMRTANQNTRIINNDFDNCGWNCLYLADAVTSSVDHFLLNNTFDGCNYTNTAGHTHGGVYSQQYNGTFYSQNDAFGVTTLNNRNNLSFKNCSTTGCSYQQNHRIIVNDPILNGPANPTWAYPIIFNQWPVSWLDRYSYGPNSYATIHNEDQVTDAHWGFGPGGMIIEHVIGAGPTGGWVDNTVNMKVTPFAADRYCRVRLGGVHVDSGDVLQVNMQVQKNQAISNGRRPRLVLKGCGFDPTVDYDEMADVNNSWDTVTVSGTTTAEGGVHLYLEVLNDLAGDATYPTTRPVEPVTIVIYADGFNWNKS